MTTFGRSLSTVCAGFVAASYLCAAPVARASLIVNVVETGGDNEATDTITAKWTGQTWNVTIANEPVNGLAVGTPFTLGSFGSTLPAYVDRNHRFLDDPGTGGFPALAIPSYLVGGEYIMSGNDNRDNNPYNLAVTINSAARVYMLIDNRLLDSSNANPPSFDTTHMQWILDQGWLAKTSGLNRFADPTVPDEVPIDEGADGSINQYFSVYYKDFPAGTFNLLQADNTGQNMYGAVVQAAVPEPTAPALCSLGLLGLLRRNRRK